MMTQPSVARIIEVIREQLAQNVATSVTDRGAVSILGMVDHLLQTVQVRAENEVQWMLLQITDILDLAERGLARDELSPAVAEAANHFRAHKSGSFATSSVTADYSLAAAVLSCMLEETVGAASRTASEAKSLLEREVQWGVDIVGPFVLVPP